jgi:hypothetical protein
MKTYIYAPFVYELQGKDIEVKRNKIVDVEVWKIYGPIFKSGIRTTLPMGFRAPFWQEVV